MHLKVKCIEKRCPDFDREQIVDVGALNKLLDEFGRGVTCTSCHSLMRILVPEPNSQRGKKRPRAAD